MTNALLNPVTRLPVDGRTREDIAVEIKVMNWNHVAFWQRHVQTLIDRHYQHWFFGVNETTVRADVAWNWSRNLALVFIHNSMRVLPGNGSGPAQAMSIIHTTDSGEEIPIGMLTAVPEFFSKVDGNAGKRAFAWYLSDAPREFYTDALRMPAIKGVATALVDCAVQCGLDVGGSGDTLLHADRHGGPKLQQFYLNKCGMQQVAVTNGPISILRRTNPHEYFHMDAPSARHFSSKLDPRRQ